jgi:PAS domain S-box-containing protein
MTDPSKKNQELIEENTLLRQRILNLEKSEAERKRMEEALRASEEKYRVLLQESPDPTFSFTPEGQYRYVNRAFADGVGKLVEDIIGKTIWDVFPKEEADKRFTSLSQVFRTGEEKVIEMRVPRPNGDRTYITTITPIADTNGKVLSAVCTSKDITDRKRMEEMLLESEEKFRTIFENSSSAMAIIERDTTISMVNREYCKMGLFEEKDVVGKSWTTQIPPGDLERLKEYNHKRLIDPESAPDHYEFTFYRSDGKTRHSLMSVAVLPTSRNIVCSFVDITERKQAEKELEEERRHLQLALDEVKTLRGILPICSNCKKIRDDKGFWNQVDQYISDHTEAEFSHGLCPNCAKELYPELYKRER